MDRGADEGGLEACLLDGEVGEVFAAVLGHRETALFGDVTVGFVEDFAVYYGADGG